MGTIYEKAILQDFQKRSSQYFVTCVTKCWANVVPISSIAPSRQANVVLISSIALSRQANVVLISSIAPSRQANVVLYIILCVNLTTIILLIVTHNKTHALSLTHSLTHMHMHTHKNTHTTHTHTHTHLIHTMHGHIPGFSCNSS